MTDKPTSGHKPDLLALSAYLDGELSGAQQHALAAHLATCPDCTATLAQWQTLAHDLRALPAETLGFDLAGVIEGRLAASPRPAPRRRHGMSPWPRLVGAAAALALGAAMGSALILGATATAPRLAVLSVFDTLPPGHLCSGLDSCYDKGNPR